MTDVELREEVRARYAEAAAGGACGSDCGRGSGFYEGEQVDCAWHDYPSTDTRISGA